MMQRAAKRDIRHDQTGNILYAHQRPEPIGPDEDEQQTPIEPPEDPAPIAPPDEVPDDRPEPVPPVPPVEVPGNPNLPGHIISRGSVAAPNQFYH